MTPTAQDIGKLVQITRDFSKSRYKSRGRLIAVNGDKATVKVFKHKGVEEYPLARLSLWKSRNAGRRGACSDHLLMLILHVAALLCCLPGLLFTIPVHVIYTLHESIEARRTK